MAETKKTASKKATSTKSNIRSTASAKTDTKSKSNKINDKEQLSVDILSNEGITPTDYDDASIRALKGPDRVRKRPQVIFGSDTIEGCEHSFFEILSNSVDEARDGHGDFIKITVYQDNSLEVEDFGRGIPLGYNEAEGRYNWDLIFCELYAGGKYENNQSGGNYEYALGLNGLGACATQYSSEYMKVWSYKNGAVSYIEFEKGYAVSDLTVTPIDRKSKQHGTIIRWKPDLEVFKEINIPGEYFYDILKRQAVANTGIRFELNLEHPDGSFATETFVYENGISDYVKELAGEKALTLPVLWHTEAEGQDREDTPIYKYKADFSFCICQDVNLLEYYHNSSHLVYGGAPDKALRTAFVYSLDKYMNANGKYQKGEAKINFNDIAGCLVYVSNSFSTIASFENQTKKSISNTFIQSSMTEYLKNQLFIYLTENPKDAEIFVNCVLVNRRSREAAERAGKVAKVKLNTAVDSSNRVEKFVNCRTKDATRRELYIVEGDSALTSCKLGRNAEFQAIIPVRGKTLNCMKSTYAKIFSSDIIIDLLRVIGCGVEQKGKEKLDLPAFSLENLKWSKIIICTDADEDGFQIRTLLLTLFYRLLPTLLKEGKVFIAESPLFEITTKDETLFAFNEAEKAEILKKLGNKKYTLQRSKGLGENEPDMMWKTTMNPETRRLIAVRPTDEAKTLYMFDTLLGDDLKERKRFISEHGGLYLKDVDV